MLFFRVLLAYGAVTLTFLTLMSKKKEWATFRDGLDNIASSFIFYPKKISLLNFNLIKPIMASCFDLLGLIRWKHNWLSFFSIPILFNVWYTSYIIFLVFHVSETYRWKFKEMNWILRKSKNTLECNFIPECYFGHQIDQLIVSKKSNLYFNKICGKFVLIYIFTTLFNLFHRVLFVDGIQNHLSFLVSFLVSYFYIFYILVISIPVSKYYVKHSTRYFRVRDRKLN